MSLSNPASSSRKMEASLTKSERRLIGIRLGCGLFAACVFLVGSFQTTFFGVQQRALGDLLKAIAAVIIAAPIFSTAFMLSLIHI